jgi:anti-sigma factor ChrR (cupin superfamily)
VEVICHVAQRDRRIQARGDPVTASKVAARELFPGIRLRSLWTGTDGASAHVLEMDPGASWIGRDIHDPGPEEVYVAEGIFNDGVRDYPAGTFIHAPAGSWHVPQSATGCLLFLFYPHG